MTAKPTGRSLGPDLARGFMLLFIALANTHYFLQAGPVLGGFPRDGSGADSAVAWSLATFVDGRAFPLFGLLFGYGAARIAERQRDRGPWGVRRLLWRRSAALIVVGLTDAVLFYVGDILAAYGVLLLLGALMIRWTDRWLLVTAAFFLVIGALPDDAAGLVSATPDPAMLPVDLGVVVTERVPAALFVAVLGPLGFLCPFAVGLWAGRRRVLERPERFRGLLLTTAMIGIPVAVLGAQPFALIVSGVSDARLAGWAVALHSTTGTLGGFGYAALVALVATRLDAGGRRHRLVAAVAAAGERSMSCYLMQSVTWAVVFTPFLLDLSGRLTVAGTALLAAVTWVVTVVIADGMRRAGRRGPFETLVRRITYGDGSARGGGYREGRVGRSRASVSP
ncbi:putative membrane protein YeiB [Actinoplanes lutulentus]|uniref:Putative membrane protein YeiB n=1 Tax=Actinoplanes lutulentus TaxID=1287878 RepID=A0A327Z866_9ACTN|nr:DUF418 domain-containing protein [Actinoplanes lutulentus]MBB2948412.1 putative membrane protein YeiB [Actinoplanes lutulentus]RAK34555.1 putative membrane protein YeiB [Actinoplanes lutulentus]